MPFSKGGINNSDASGRRETGSAYYADYADTFGKMLYSCNSINFKPCLGIQHTLCTQGVGKSPDNSKVTKQSQELKLLCSRQ